MTPEELNEFKEEFCRVDPHNDRQLRKWFLDYPELTTAENAMIMGISQRWVSARKKSLGLTRIIIIETSAGVKILRKRAKKKTTLKPPAEGIEDWIIDQAVNNKVTVLELSKAVLRSRGYVKRVLKAHRKKPNNTIHPCMNKEWVEEHFVKQRLSLRRCARIAGVSYGTIRGWLSHFGINNRDSFEAAPRGLLGKKTSNTAHPPPPRRSSKAAV